jgi:hypothetical protein
MIFIEKNLKQNFSMNIMSKIPIKIRYNNKIHILENKETKINILIQMNDKNLNRNNKYNISMKRHIKI